MNRWIISTSVEFFRCALISWNDKRPNNASPVVRSRGRKYPSVDVVQRGVDESFVFSLSFVEYEKLMRFLRQLQCSVSYSTPSNRTAKVQQTITRERSGYDAFDINQWTVKSRLFDSFTLIA